MPPKDTLLNKSQLAAELGVSRAYITRLTTRGMKFTLGKITKKEALHFIKTHPDPVPSKELSK